MLNPTGIMLDKSKGPTPPLEAVLEPELIDAISKLLNDRNSQVKVAAAITLYSLNKPGEKVINEYMVLITNTCVNFGGNRGCISYSKGEDFIICKICFYLTNGFLWLSGLEKGKKVQKKTRICIGTVMLFMWYIRSQYL